MAERPIPFTAAMVRALLAGTKTQTRRVVKITHRTPGLAACLMPKAGGPRPHVAAELCPYGQPGDRLWVREAWRAPTSCDHLPPRSIADSEARRFVADEVIGPEPGFGKFRQGMFMPRWASRILLEVTNVRAQRLQDISEADAVAEGLTQTATGSWLPGPCDHPEWAYHQLWDQINGRGSWEANPWVWAVSFRVIQGGQP